MKILQINASYKPAFIYGGPTMSVSKLSEVLTQHKISTEVLTTSANGENELEVTLNTPILIDTVPVTYYKRVTKDHTHFSPALCWALIGKITQAKKQANSLILHIHAWWNLVSIFTCIIGILKNTPVIISPRGTLSSYSFGNKNDLIKRAIHQLLGKPLLKRCHFHVTSENERRAILALITPKSISVISNLVNLPGLSVQSSEVKKKTSAIPAAQLETEDDGGTINLTRLKLLFFSRIEHKKGLELLFEALKNINIPYLLTIAGGGDENYTTHLKGITQVLGIDSHISWIGQQPPEKKFEIMSSYDLMVLPSYDENFANVVIESLSCGTPVLITENVGLSDYVLNNNLGWVCKFDKNDLQQNLIKAFKSVLKRDRIKHEAPFKIREDFSEQKLCQKYIEMYNKVLRE